MAKAKKKPAKKPAKAAKKSAKAAKKPAPKAAKKKPAAKKPAPKKVVAKKPAGKAKAAKPAAAKRAPKGDAGEAHLAHGVGYVPGSAPDADAAPEVDTAWGNEHTHNDPEPAAQAEPDRGGDDHDDE
jgi:DnaK suppressor protein